MDIESLIGSTFILLISSLIFLLVNYDNKQGRALLNPFPIGFFKRVFKDKNPKEYIFFLWFYRIISILGFMSGLYLMIRII